MVNDMKKQGFLFSIALCICGFSLFLFSGCQETAVVSNVKAEELFSLDYGLFENELGFYPSLFTGNCTSSIVMQDGFFYILDSNSLKMMNLNSYGDLLSIIYNKDTNPQPSFLSFSGIKSESDGKPTANATQRATSYPFNRVGPMAVDASQQLFIADYLPQDRYETDSETGSLLRQVILHFSEDGEFIDYIGQQGPGGSPFPFIKNIYTTGNNEMVTVCLTVDGYTVYWFSQDGFLKYMIPILFSALPVREEDVSPDLFINLGGIIPDYNAQKLYVKIDYSHTVFDESSKVQSGISYDKTLLYSLDVTTGLYEDPLTIPPFEQIINTDYNRDIFPVPYEFLGVTETGWMFFSSADGNGYTIMMVQPNGQKILKRHLTIPDENALFYNVYLSKNGIITMMLSSDEKTSITWWRTDEIIQALN